MNKLKIYLSSAMQNVEENFQSWRSTCQMLRQNGYYTNLEFVDPINYFNYIRKQPKTDGQCLDFLMWQIDHCDVLLVNLDYSNSSCGAAMEVEHAYCNNIPIIAYGTKPNTWYNWIRARSSTDIFSDLEDAIDYIHNSYGKVLC